MVWWQLSSSAQTTPSGPSLPCCWLFTSEPLPEPAFPNYAASPELVKASHDFSVVCGAGHKGPLSLCLNLEQLWGTIPAPEVPGWGRAGWGLRWADITTPLPPLPYPASSSLSDVAAEITSQCTFTPESVSWGTWPTTTNVYTTSDTQCTFDQFFPRFLLTSCVSYSNASRLESLLCLWLPLSHQNLTIPCLNATEEHLVKSWLVMGRCLFFTWMGGV